MAEEDAEEAIRKMMISKVFPRTKKQKRKRYFFTLFKGTWTKDLLMNVKLNNNSCDDTKNAKALKMLISKIKEKRVCMQKIK